LPAKMLPSSNLVASFIINRMSEFELDLRRSHALPSKSVSEAALTTADADCNASNDWCRVGSFRMPQSTGFFENWGRGQVTIVTMRRRPWYRTWLHVRYWFPFSDVVGNSQLASLCESPCLTTHLLIQRLIGSVFHI
jgi:hypothetical protein